MEHYYTSKENVSTESLLILGDEAKHLVKVLRKKPGEEIYVTDGLGNLFKCSIDRFAKESIECKIIEKILTETEPAIKFMLYQSLLKNPDRFEFAIEKSVELGVREIQPIITEFVISKNKDRTERWNSISLAAMKQSQRVYLPRVKHPMTFAEAITSCNSDLKLIAHEKISDVGIGISNLKTDKNNSVALFIGPEGGFSDNEIESALLQGFKLLNLGKRKLRSETAAIYVIAKFM